MPTGCSRSPMRRGLPEDRRARTAVRPVGGDQHAQRVGRAALLHQDRGQPGVAGAGRQQRGEHGRPEPRVEVVDVGLQQQRRLAGRRPVDARPSPAVEPSRLEPTSSRSTFVCARRVRPPAPSRSRSTVIAGCGRRSRSASAVSRAAPVGRAELDVDRSAVRRGAAAAARRPPGAGTGSRPCAVPTVTAAERDRGDDVHRAARGASSAAQHPDHVGDRVERADLVEVHVVRRRCRAPRASASASRAKTSRAPGAHAGRRGRPPRAARGRRARCGAAASATRDVDPGRREPVPAYDLGASSRDRLGRHRVDGGLHHRRAARRHRPGRRAACRRWRRRRRRPSRLVTAGRQSRGAGPGVAGHPGGVHAGAVAVVDVARRSTPGAHEFSIASSAARPPNEAP